MGAWRLAAALVGMILAVFMAHVALAQIGQSELAITPAGQFDAGDHHNFADPARPSDELPPPQLYLHGENHRHRPAVLRLSERGLVPGADRRGRDLTPKGDIELPASQTGKTGLDKAHAPTGGRRGGRR